jgi:hypothetical protein
LFHIDKYNTDDAYELTAVPVKSESETSLKKSVKGKTDATAVSAVCAVLRNLSMRRDTSLQKCAAVSQL